LFLRKDVRSDRLQCQSPPCHTGLAGAHTPEARAAHADIPEENIMCVLHDCFDFIDDARSKGGRVLVHCSQGVSRSATIVIAYCMWKLALPYDDVVDHAKKIRHVISPNVGFQCAPAAPIAASTFCKPRGSRCRGVLHKLHRTAAHAYDDTRRAADVASQGWQRARRFELLQWQKRRLQGIKKCFMCRLAPQSVEDPLYIVPKAVSDHDWSALDSRGVFLVQAPGAYLHHTQVLLQTIFFLRCVVQTRSLSALLLSELLAQGACTSGLAARRTRPSSPPRARPRSRRPGTTASGRWRSRPSTRAASRRRSWTRCAWT
jgi:Dual specificity phosphatase, catalytic domain